MKRIFFVAIIAGVAVVAASIFPLILYFQNAEERSMEEAEFLVDDTDELMVNVLSLRSQSENNVHRLSGEVQNNFDYPVKNVKVVYHYYDESTGLVIGKVIAPIDKPLEPGEKATFEVIDPNNYDESHRSKVFVTWDR